ncbi:MAG: TetR/AcrR family transcriptional regulator [Thermoleophilia bacterium]|nr:TetR/AcrR family transcriptional regulator [Thermoleophilia bacterium]
MTSSDDNDEEPPARNAGGATRGRPGRPKVGEESGPSRRRRIREAAVTVFAAKGYHDARVSDIAKEAGVAHGLVYHYFAGKENLLQDVFRRTWLHIEQGLRTIEKGGGSAADQLADIVRLLLGSYRMSPDLVRVVVLEVTRSGHLRAQVDEIAEAFRIIERIITTGQERGELRDDIPARLVSFVFWGAVDEVLTGWVFGTLPGTDEDVAEAERAVVELVLRGLAGTGTPSPDA